MNIQLTSWQRVLEIVNFVWFGGIELKNYKLIAFNGYHFISSTTLLYTVAYAFH